MTHNSDVHRPREEATAVTPTTPNSEDPPGPSLPLGRLTSASVAVHSAGLPVAGSTPSGGPAPETTTGPEAPTAFDGTPALHGIADVHGTPDAHNAPAVPGTPDGATPGRGGVPAETGLPAPAQEPPSVGGSGAGSATAFPPAPGGTANDATDARSHPAAPSEAGGTKPGGVRDTAPATERGERQFSGVGGRRTVVIGTDTTGAIPVHLLYRDAVASAGATARGAAGRTAEALRTEPATGADATRPLNGTSAHKGPDGGTQLKDRRSAFGVNGPTKDVDGDSGPDTIAMPPVASATGRRSAPGAGQAARRPAPPPDPRLVERPGPVLPGWAALLAGAVSLVACAAVLHWAGAFPPEVTTLFGLGERPYGGLGFVHWGVLAVSLTVALFSLGGLARGRVGHAWVLTLYGEYRGSVRRSGLMWVSPLLLRRRVDVRLRHWRSDPMPSVDADGTALEAVVLVVWRVRDTARAVLGVANHESYLREQVEAALARVLSQIPADASAPAAAGGPALELRPTLRNAEAVGDALTKTLAAECAPIGIDVFSAQPTRIEYAPEVAAAMRRRRVAALEAERRDTVLSSVVDAVDDTVQRLTMRGLVEFDDYERKALVRDLTVAFCTARTGGAETP
ncbi:SPFH domain-containing protein [Streptomyces sp. HNM0645]|uniref:SPFH domain-containing protein n=1 Tax=Streptomyces sp. HNM0645 TaxID=2782343 RepID=UPI0024B77126|nr:SPFH domain-containing protein [Streptomyces sp. HNM0645]MDI9889016.1 SPFH domain-containing protein [Streptomyces sp. HNM0645]